MFQSKTNEALHLLQKLTKPETMNLEDEQTGQYMTEEAIIKDHVQTLQRKYMDFLKETEVQYKQNVKELKEMQAQGLIQGPSNLATMSTHLYKIKQVCQRVTMEGEHTCLVLLQHD